MVTRRNCVNGVAERNNRKEKEVDEDLKEMLERAAGYESDGMNDYDALKKSGIEMYEEAQEKARLARRAALMDARKDIARRRYFRDTMKAIDNFDLAGAGDTRRILQNVGLPINSLADSLKVTSARLALEAKLVGVNLPIFEGRKSVDSQFVTIREEVTRAFEQDLGAAKSGDLLKLFADRQFEKQWTDELFQLWRGRRGAPGISKNAQALEIAQIVMKYQKQTIEQINREGGWVRTYSGYVTRTSHDADAIKRAGAEKWARDTLEHLDVKRTFGTTDRQKAMDALREMYNPMATGDHFDYGKPRDEPMFPNVAKRAAAERELHFKSAEDWRAYNAKYGVSNPTLTVVNAIEGAARRIALMKEFGTKPAEAFEGDLNYLKAWTQAEARNATEKLSKLQGPDSDVNSPAVKSQIAEFEAQARLAGDKFLDFQKWDQPLRNRFAQIDGSASRPVNKLAVNLANGEMAIQRTSKLGRVALTHFASLPTKSQEARHWGISFGERYASLFRGLTRGAAGSEKRQVLEHFMVANNARLGHMMAIYDVADAPRGFLAKWEARFFRLTGVSRLLDNQQGDAQAMFAAHIGSKRGLDWAQIGPKEQRVLQGFGLGEPEWKALHGVDWTEIGGRRYLMPTDAKKLSDDQIREYMASLPRRTGKSISADEVAKTRDDLALQLATAYSDRSRYAMNIPDARLRASLYRNTKPGDNLNTAMRLLLQFRAWPLAMIQNTWGREMYGRIGDTKMDRISGLVEFFVACAVFGTASEVVRKEIQGIDGPGFVAQHPLAALVSGLQRSGFGTMFGDFLLGEFDRHGFSAVDSLVGPTFGQIDTLMDLIHGGGAQNRHPWNTRAADTLKMARDNTPFMNLWMSNIFANYLVWYRLQDWINPGYTQRMERKMKDTQGQQFWLSPQNPGQSLGISQ